MSDEGSAFVAAKRAAAQAGLDAQGRARAAAFLNRPRCVVCGHPMLVAGRDRHFMCDESSPVGKVCVCPPGCTDERYGDGRPVERFGGRPCDPACVPCRVNSGRLHKDVRA